MFRKLLALIALAALVWLGARYFAHRGDIKATVMIHSAARLRKGDPVVENGRAVGRIIRISPIDDGQDAVVIRIDRDHRRDIVTDSLLTVDDRRLVVNNTFAVGKPIDDGAVLHVKDDRFSRWLAKHANAVQPLVEKVKRAADEKLDAIDAELASATAKVPDWKREGKDVFDKNIGELKTKIDKAEDDLKRSDKLAEAKKLREKFDRWLAEVQR
jgi:ABC-type transporter Mla subunit MlaD